MKVTLSRNIYLGNTLETLIKNNKLSRSLSILSFTPGYYIFTTTYLFIYY